MNIGRKEDFNPDFFSGLRFIDNNFYLSMHHSKDDKKKHMWLSQIAKDKGKPIYALDDNSSIVVINGNLQLHGDIRII